MPHDIPPGNEKAHGFVLAFLKNKQDATEAIHKIQAMTPPERPKTLTIRSASHFEDRDLPPDGSGHRNPGIVVAVFVDSDDLITDENAHTALKTLATNIRNLDDGQTQPKTYFNRTEHY